MPITISDIMVPSNENELEEIEDDSISEIRCSLCKATLELESRNNYKPKLHTLDICLQKIIKCSAIEIMLETNKDE